MSGLIAVLENTLSPDAVLRNTAERSLSEHSNAPGFVAALVQVAGGNNGLGARHAATLRLKNLCFEKLPMRRAKVTANHTTHRFASEDDMIALKREIIDLVVREKEPRLRVQFLEIFLQVLRNQPEWIMEAIETSVAHIHRGGDGVYGGSALIRMVFKVFQYRRDSSREPIVAVSEQLMPLFLTILESAVAQKEWELARVIVKIYYIDTQQKLVHSLQIPEVFNRWYQAFITILSTPMDDTCNMTPLTRTQKWISRILVRFLKRFTVLSIPEYKDFATYFVNSGPAAIALQVFVGMLLNSRATLPLPVCRIAFEFTRGCVDYASLYALLRPHVHRLIFEAILPAIIMSEEDLELWESDPREFVFKSLGSSDDMYDPKTAASELLKHLVCIRTRDTLNTVLNTCSELLKDPTKSRDIDSGLCILGILSEDISSNKELAMQVQSTICSSILPILQKSPDLVLRRRACRFIGEYATIVPPQALLPCVNGIIVNLLRTEVKELPIRADAAIALTCLLRRKDEESADAIFESLKYNLDDVFKGIFRLLDEVRCEECVSCLDEIINHFDNEIAPYAAELVKMLMNIYQEFATSAEDDYAEDAEEGAICAAYQAISSINTVIYSVAEVPSVLPEIEVILAPLLEKAFSQHGLDIIEDCLEMIASLTFYAPPGTISDFMWGLVPRMMKSLEDTGADVLRNMLLPVENMITKDKARFLSHPELLSVIVNSAFNYMQDVICPNSVINSCHMLEVVITSCRSGIDTSIPAIMGATLSCFQTSMKTERVLPSVNVEYLNLLGVCAHYNPCIFVQVLGEMGVIFDLFNSWMSLVESMGSRTRNQASLTLSSMFLIPLSGMAVSVHQLLPRFLSWNIQLLCLIKNTVDAEAQLYSQSTRGPKETPLETFRDIPDNQDFLDGDDADHMELMLQYAEGKMYSTDDEDDDFESTNERINAFIFFVDSFKSFAHTNGQVYESLMHQLSPEEQDTLGLCINHAETLRICSNSSQ